MSGVWRPWIILLMLVWLNLFWFLAAFSFESLFLIFVIFRFDIKDLQLNWYWMSFSYNLVHYMTPLLQRCLILPCRLGWIGELDVLSSCPLLFYCTCEAIHAYSLFFINEVYSFDINFFFKLAHLIFCCSLFDSSFLTLKIKIKMQWLITDWTGFYLMVFILGECRKPSRQMSLPYCEGGVLRKQG